MTTNRNRFLAGGGEMGELIRNHDWQATSIGAPGTWPQTLKTVIRLLLSTGHPMFVWWGPELIQFYNDAFRRSIGPERHPSALGQRGRECWEEIWDIIGPQVEQVMAGDGYTWNVNHLVPITRYGKREDVYWTYSYSPIDDPDADNQVGGILVLCTETTEQVITAQKLRESDRRKTEFLAMLSHELRNPLSSIMHASELLQTGDRNSDTQQLGKVLMRQTSQLKHIVDDLLDVTRINRDKIELQLEVIDLGYALKLGLEAVQPALDRKQHNLVSNVNVRPIYVYADLTRTVQCIANVLGNAIKFSEPEGRIEVTLREDDGMASLTIRDYGVGMSSETRSNIFELFFQGNPSLDRYDAGMGIGLSLVKRLIDMHGGEIIAASDGVGLGSTFEIRLPLSTSRTASMPSHDPDSALPRRVLVVDDNSDAADTLTQLLVNDGHDCEVAYNASDALKSIERFHPEVVLLDIGLPDMNGYDVAKTVREDRAEIRLIAVTGYGQEDDVQRARAAGFDAHVTKPVRFHELRRLMSAG